MITFSIILQSSAKSASEDIQALYKYLVNKEIKHKTRE